MAALVDPVVEHRRPGDLGVHLLLVGVAAQPDGGKVHHLGVGLWEAGLVRREGGEGQLGGRTAGGRGRGRWAGRPLSQEFLSPLQLGYLNI